MNYDYADMLILLCNLLINILLREDMMDFFIMNLLTLSKFAEGSENMIKNLPFFVPKQIKRPIPFVFK